VLGHGVERGTVLEPLELRLVESVREGNVKGIAALCWVDSESHWLAYCKLSAENVNLVVRLDLVVVGGVGEGQRHHTLLLEVGLVLCS